jgi:hypothetical protein
LRNEIEGLEKRLAALSQEMEEVGLLMLGIGMVQEHERLEAHGWEMLGASKIAQEWIGHIQEVANG